MTPAQISDSILNHLKTLNLDDQNDVMLTSLRMGIGLTLCSVHAVGLMSAKGDEAQERAVGEAFDSVDRIISCLKRDIEAAGIEGVEIYTNETPNLRIIN